MKYNFQTLSSIFVISLCVGCISPKPSALTKIQINIQNQYQDEIPTIKLKYKQGEIVIDHLRSLESTQRRLQTRYDTDLVVNIQYLKDEHINFIIQAGTIGQLDLSITPQREVSVSGQFSSDEY